VFVLLGNHLFPWKHLAHARDEIFVMNEDLELCTYVRHHQQKIVLFLAAMRRYADELRARGVDLRYIRADDERFAWSYERKLDAALRETGCDELKTFEVEDRFFARRLDAWAESRGVRRTILPSPMFLTDRATFRRHIEGGKRPFMARFYEAQRRRLGILLEADRSPVGGKWSFDAENRRRVPKGLAIPSLPAVTLDAHVPSVIEFVSQRFAEHPGKAEEFAWPVSRRGALAWFQAFLRDRLGNFGPYEDAISSASPFLFHSLLTPMLNLGLVTPDELVDRAIAHAEEGDVPLNSLEGFIRQVIGWREFVRGIDHEFGEEQEARNFFSASRRLGPSWWNATTRIVPLDETIRTALRYGWTHHIERLMVAGSMMTLCGVHPREAYRWFMEMYVDSSDWVMGPNVYGMGIFSDGGIFATKPYICGSNYLLKMSDYGKGDWCEIVDGLFWRFIERHRTYFLSNPRLAMMARSLDRMDEARRQRLFAQAEQWLDHHCPV